MKLKKSIIKTLISAALIILVLSLLDLNELILEVKQASWWGIAIVIVGYFVGQCLSCYKWCLLAQHGGIKTDFPQAFKAYFTGMFANSFGLGVLGGDVARALLVSKEKDPKTVCMASVIADRLHGMTILCLIGFTAAMIFGTHTVQPKIMSFVVMLEVAIIIGWFIGPWALKRLPLKGKLKSTAEQVAAVFPHKIGPLLIISSIGALFHITQISLHAVMAYSLGADVPLSVLFVVIPFVNILATLPISWNGVGVRESGYLFFLTPLFLARPEAVAFGGIWLLAVTINSALGGIIASIYGTNKLIREQ